MFRVQTQRFGTTRQVFTVEDPRKAGYKGDAEDGVNLEFDMEAVYTWPEGERMPEACLGRSLTNPKQYKVFKYRHELDAAGYEFVPGTTSKFGWWLDYLRLHLEPPDPDQTDEVEWYDYLDHLDQEWRRLGEKSPWPETPKSTNRDDVAAWVAKKHFVTDASIHEIWYLPQGAPADEIRLLEVNERLTGDVADVEPIDFGLDVSGARFKLFVADLSSDQLEQLKRDPSRLPAGWRVDGNLVWRRRPA